MWRPETLKQAGEKILPLESLRGIAALSVVVYHAGGQSTFLDNAFFRHAYVMVDFFFVLSGYVIALNYFDRVRDLRSLADFQIKRFWRLYPLHLATLLAFLAIEVAKYAFQLKTGITANNPAFSVNDGGAFLANLVLLQGIVMPSPSFNIPSWSISAEFYTYLIFGLVLLVPARRLIIVLVAIAGFAVFALFQDGLIADDYRFTLLRCVMSFFTGACVYLVLRSRPMDFPAFAQPLALVTAALCVIALTHTSGEILLPVVFALVIVVFSSGRDQWIARALSVRPLVWLGTISYSVYMTHSGVWWATEQFYRFALKLPTITTETGQVWLLYPEGTQLIYQGIQLALTLLVSQLTYSLIEVPFRYGLPRRKTANAGPAGGKA
ncbi:MAG: hypothetical protein CML30_04370 [Rhizobiales bacterium]|nr:hypothetical protein [Hyphomicrobiales bacterium]